MYIFNRRVRYSHKKKRIGALRVDKDSIIQSKEEFDMIQNELGRVLK